MRVASLSTSTRFINLLPVKTFGLTATAFKLCVAHNANLHLEHTSKMTTKIYWIGEKQITKGKLGIMPRPRGNDWLEDEIKALKFNQVDKLISMLERHETHELGLLKEQQICEKHEIDFINFPVKDVSVPNSQNDFIDLTKKLFNEIQSGKSIVIHCRMGIGRSSVLASAIMIKFGIEKTGVFEVIANHRKLKVPDTDEQKDWIDKVAEKIK